MNQDPKGPVPFRSVQTRFSVSHIILARTKKISISEWCKICGWSVPMFWWKRFFLSCPVQTWDANVCLYLFRFLCANLNMTLRLWTLTGPVFRISYLLLASDKKFCGVKSACHGPNHCFRMCIFFFFRSLRLPRNRSVSSRPDRARFLHFLPLTGLWQKILWREKCLPWAKSLFYDVIFLFFVLYVFFRNRVPYPVFPFFV